MRCLLDTPVLLWALARSARLPSDLLDWLADPANDIFYSAASIWEVAIKHGLKRADFVVPPGALERGVRDAGFVELPVTSTVACSVADLPRHHRDPFDRLLFALAMSAGLTLHTADPLMSRYGPFVKQIA